MEFRHELVVPNNDLPFRMFIFEGKNGNYQVVKHWHNTVELFLVFEGNIDFYINSVYYPISKNQFILVNSNEIHSIDAPRENLTIVLQIPQETFEAYREEEYILFKSTRYEEDSELISLIRNMYRIYADKKYGYELEVKSYFYKLLYILITKYKEKDIDKERIRQNRQLEKLSHITEFIQEHYQDDITLESVASKFGFSPTYLSRIFQKYAKINYKSYLLDVRVQHGFKELMNTEKSVSEIAENNGFPDSRSFSKAFCKRYGVLPSVYRKDRKGRK
ncbi:MAG: AraC family transcriptional regulator [Lachnospiraceae bacterium]|nr:AraC family transcriptional regulator [Lachnospiraceae bacterium]MDD3661165.1 AraC family transcriptional regulator [Lachnospiraceae bacterium]